MSKITFAENAWEEYLYWQGQDKKTLRKINSLLKTILRDPFDGDGKPEPLKGNRKGQWSRKINEKDRLFIRSMPEILLLYSVRVIMMINKR